MGRKLRRKDSLIAKIGAMNFLRRDLHGKQASKCGRGSTSCLRSNLQIGYKWHRLRKVGGKNFHVGYKTWKRGQLRQQRAIMKWQPKSTANYQMKRTRLGNPLRSCRSQLRGSVSKYCP